MEPQLQQECSLNPIQYLSFILNSLSIELGPNCVDNYIRNGLNVDLLYEDEWLSKTVKIWFLPLEFEDSPLYRSGLEKEKIIPTTQLSELLKRYDKTTVTLIPDGHGGLDRKRFSLRKNRQYVIMNVPRFQKSAMGRDKSFMYVQLPPDPLDLSPYGANAQYELHAILAHEGTNDQGEFVVYQRIKSTGMWFKCTSNKIIETSRDDACLSQSCLLLYQKI